MYQNTLQNAALQMQGQGALSGLMGSAGGALLSSGILASNPVAWGIGGGLMAGGLLTR